MGSMDLFVHKSVLSFEKVASVQLGEDTSSWPREILTELYRSAPETSDYTPRVAMLKIDEEQGFGLGVIIIENSTNSALAVSRPGPAARRILVPVIVKNHKLCPLDVIMTKSGKLVPLNGNRLRETLFRPETFEMITEDHGDTSLYNIFYPPGRSDNTFGSGMSQGIGNGAGMSTIMGPGMKSASAEEAGEFVMLRGILPTILGPDIDRCAKIAGDTVGMLGVSKNFVEGLRVLSGAEKTASASADDLYEQALSVASPDVVQMGFSEAHEKYWVKTASRGCFHDGRSTVVGMTRSEFLKFAGNEIAKKVDTEGTVTVSHIKIATDDVDTSRWEVVSKPGIYKVKTVQGKELTGWVIPSLVDTDGTKVPMMVFTNGSAAMVQDQIVGAHIAAGVDLPAGTPKGTGCFYMAGTGGVEATVPLLIQGGEAGMDGGDNFLVKTLTGEETRVRLVPGLKRMTVMKNEFLIPDTAKFMPLEDEAVIPLVDRLDGVEKTAAALAVPSITIYGGDDTEYSFRYHNLPKMASAIPQRLDRDSAVFALCLAGLDAQTAHSKLAAASYGQTIAVPNLHDIKLASDLIESTRKTASARSHEVTALRRYLVKEAAALPDGMTVDAILSLGFINSENVKMYISRIPYLEKCLSMVCELLVGGRVGLTEIPEFAAARCARGLDEVIQGLKALAMREIQDGTTSGA